jgi:large subunit ribosomal protein L25
MKTVSISGSPRENVGKKDAKAARRAGLVPCVIYGGKEQIHFTVPTPNFKNIIYTPEVCIVKINVGGKEYNTVVKETQFHTVNDSLLHVDFLEFSDKKPVVMNIPVKITGSAPGVREGGKLHAKLRTLQISALASAMPDFVEVNIEKLNIGDSIRIADLKIKDVTFIDDPNAVVAGVRVTRVVKEEDPAVAAAAAGAAPAAGAAAPAAGKEGAPAAGAADAKKPEAKKPEAKK